MAPNKRKNRESGAGFSDPNHQTLGMGNERFMVPEALFHPSDVGLKQAGVAEATARAVEAVKRDARLKGLFYANVVLCGGCAALPGFKERFERELRPFVDAGDVLNVSVAADGDPVGAAWRGGSRLGASDEFARAALTREAYLKDPAAIVGKLEQHAPVIPGRA
jgi:actin-related protein 6